MDNLGQRLKVCQAGALPARAGATGRRVPVLHLADRERQVPAVRGHAVLLLPAPRRLRGRALRRPRRAGAERDAGNATPRRRGRTSNGSGRMDPIHAWQPSEYSNRVSVVHPSHRPQLTMAEGVVWERLAATPEHARELHEDHLRARRHLHGGGELVAHDGYEYGYVRRGRGRGHRRRRGLPLRCSSSPTVPRPRRTPRSRTRSRRGSSVAAPAVDVAPGA